MDATKENSKDAKDPLKKTVKNPNFFVNTKFHFENNSWTWTNGGQINANEWLAVEGMYPIHPVTPIQVFY